MVVDRTLGRKVAEAALDDRSCTTKETHPRFHVGRDAHTPLPLFLSNQSTFFFRAQHVCTLVSNPRPAGKSLGVGISILVDIREWISADVCPIVVGQVLSGSSKVLSCQVALIENIVSSSKRLVAKLSNGLEQPLRIIIKKTYTCMRDSRNQTIGLVRRPKPIINSNQRRN